MSLAELAEGCQGFTRAQWDRLGDTLADDILSGHITRIPELDEFNAMGA
jgi:hypothetical protein